MLVAVSRIAASMTDMFVPGMPVAISIDLDMLQMCRWTVWSSWDQQC